MANNTYSWTATIGSVSTAWTTIADWSTTPAPTSGSFNSQTSDFTIAASNNLSLSGFGVSSENIDSLFVNDSNATLSFGPSTFQTETGLTLQAGTINAAGQDGGTIDLGGSSGVSANLTVNGVLEAGGSSGGSGYNINGDGNSNLATVTGSGTIIDTGGSLDFASVSISSVNFQIADNSGDQGLLIFQGDINSGSVAFEGQNGILATTSTLVINGGGSLVNGGTFGATISGLVASPNTTMLNGIDLASFTDTITSGSVVANGSNSILEITDSESDTFSFNLSGLADVGATVLTQADTAVGEGTDVYLMVCYTSGTAILTDQGETAVETIQAGDTVMTQVDGMRVPQTVKRVGHRDLDLTRHSNLGSVAPVRILRGALGDNLPHRDLVLSPDHCLFVDGALFPVKLLVNGMTIAQDMAAKSVTYHHVELERHAVMFAEGVAAESYLDTGNRAFFSNAGVAMILHPEMTINPSLRCWEDDACAPLSVKPDQVKPVWQRFADRAVALGHSAPEYETTNDAAIHLMVDGKAVRPLMADGKTISFMVPAKARSVRLVSRATRPSALTPWLDDPRNLGISIRSVTVRDQTGEFVLGADHPALRDGWHTAERAANGALWRWSTGDAALPIRTDGPCTLEIALSETTTYIEDGQRAAA